MPYESAKPIVISLYSILCTALQTESTHFNPLLA